MIAGSDTKITYCSLVHLFIILQWLCIAKFYIQVYVNNAAFCVVNTADIYIIT